MRGEHDSTCTRSPRDTGSSPHARGTLVWVVVGCGCVGIIPACAGNTRRTYEKTTRRRDHPRMRGEHRFGMACALFHAGSSPHARGTRESNLKTDYLPGIIPACAGNTFDRARNEIRKQDHPRMRGEHPFRSITVISAPLSSPHARGTPSDKGNSVSHTGIIPACAGNTSWDGIVSKKGRDHPRMRGEHGLLVVLWLCWLGSSPHARGTQAITRRQGSANRIIPACAGNTSPNHYNGRNG